MFGFDVTPLKKSPQYRKLYFAAVFSTLGGSATYVATAYQMKLLTNSPLAVGSLGLFELIPLLGFGLYGGVIADHWNRRKVIVTCEIVLGLSTILLFLNACLPHPQIWAIYLFDVFLVSAGSIQTPSLTSLNQLFVEHEHQPLAARLGSLRQTSMALIGPAVGGLLAVSFGVRWAYFLNIATFAFSLGLLISLAPVEDIVSTVRSQGAKFKEGLVYAKSRSDIVGTYIVDVLAMGLAYPVLMMPFVAERFHASWALGALYTSLPLGALLATVLSKWTQRVHRYGRMIVIVAALWGLGVAIFGMANSFILAYVGLAFAGATDAYSALFRQSMWNQSIPPEVRGRMGGIEMISYAIGPMAGQFRAGVMATWTSIRFSLVFGGLAATGSIATVGAALPSLWRFDASTDANVALVKSIREEEAND